MTLVRWNPWREIDTLQHQINRLFDEDRVAATGWGREFNRVPSAELSETEDAIQLKLEVPGIEAFIPGCASHRGCRFYCR